MTAIEHRGRGPGRHASTAREVVEEHLAAHRRSATASCNAFNLVTADEARAAADEIDRRVAAGDDPGPLAGVPLALKDNLCTRGVPTTCSSRILEGWRPPYTATVGRTARRRGRHHRSARRTSTSSRWARPPRTRRSGRPRTRTTRVASPAARRAAARPRSRLTSRRSAFGSDTGGSIRQPASFCGVVGMKPTYGRVSRYGLVAFASSLDQIGPFGATVADAGLALDIIAATTRMDSTSIPEPSTDVSADAERRRRRPAHRRGRRAARRHLARRARSARRRDGRVREGRRDDRRRVDAVVHLRRHRVLPHRSGRGVEQPRPVRRRALRPASRRRATRRR